jgi:multidrug efflux pump subunit AcrA (membrane-fusion protein)
VKHKNELLKIDPADFDNAVSIRKSELAQAEASLKIEEGRQSLAKKELKLLEGTIEDANRDLVLRKPQIASIKAEVSAAQAAMDRADLDLQRTSIKAPFDAQILDRSVNEGSQVSPGDELARLVGIEVYWVMASVPIRSLNWIVFPEGEEEKGSKVTLKNTDTWPANAEREGYVSRMIGELNQRTRLARVLITVKDPLALGSKDSEDQQAEKPDLQPLILGSLIETHITGRPIENVIRLKREYVRDQDTVWVMKDEKLEIRETEIEFRDATHAYIRSGLEEGEEVVTTNLATVAEGIGLRKYQAESNGVDEQVETESSEETSD